MRKIIVSDVVKLFSTELASKAGDESECFPVDRHFLNKHIGEILSLNKQEFLLCNFEMINPTYCAQLMLCLPELWKNTNVDDIEELIYNFTNVFSYYSIIEFMYTYLEIDILTFIVEREFVDNEIKKDIIDFLQERYQNYFKEENDIFFTEGLYGVTPAAGAEFECYQAFCNLQRV